MQSTHLHPEASTTLMPIVKTRKMKFREDQWLARITQPVSLGFGCQPRAVWLQGPSLPWSLPASSIPTAWHLTGRLHKAGGGFITCTGDTYSKAVSQMHPRALLDYIVSLVQGLVDLAMILQKGFSRWSQNTWLCSWTFLSPGQHIYKMTRVTLDKVVVVFKLHNIHEAETGSQFIFSPCPHQFLFLLPFISWFSSFAVTIPQLYLLPGCSSE